MEVDLLPCHQFLMNLIKRW
jgi:hypothetical protein